MFWLKIWTPSVTNSVHRSDGSRQRSQHSLPQVNWQNVPSVSYEMCIRDSVDTDSVICEEDILRQCTCVNKASLSARLIGFYWRLQRYRQFTVLLFAFLQNRPVSSSITLSLFERRISPTVASRYHCVVEPSVFNTWTDIFLLKN